MLHSIKAEGAICNSVLNHAEGCYHHTKIACMGLCRLQELTDCFVSRYYALTSAGRQGVALLAHLYTDNSVRSV